MAEKSITQPNKEFKLSNSEQSEQYAEKDQSITNSIFLNKEVLIESEQQELDRIQRIEDEKQHLAEQVTTLEKLHNRDKATIKDLNEVISNGSFVVAEHILSRTCGENIIFEFSIGIEEVKKYISLFTAKESIESLWFSGTVSKDTGKVIEIRLGRRISDNIET